MDKQQVTYKEKSVIIHRDENGFGLRVGGQNPVFVDHVHENGAAWKAGVRNNDRIIKVNGTLVKSYDHSTVVHMIQGCSPFVNLTLHSPETVVSDPFLTSASGMQSNEPNTSGLMLGSSDSNDINAANNNSISNNKKAFSLHQRLHTHHPHSVSNNLNWLLNIGDDLFQDNLHKSQTDQQCNLDSVPVTCTSSIHQAVGVSKLIVSGPSPLITSHPQLVSSKSGSIGKPKLRHNRNQSSKGDNPYYYYKTAPEKCLDNNSINSATTATSLLSQDQGSSKSSASSSIVRSRSSGKMSSRSTLSGKYKARNLRSRLVEDFKSLSIVNSQATPSSLSTSPSSSDLSDCDYQGPLHICSTMNTSTNSSLSGGQNSSFGTHLGVNQQNPRHTTRRLEIIRELVDTEKAHVERLKHLNDLLYKPIKAEGLVPPEQLKMVFSCHKTLFKIHRQIYKTLSATQISANETHQEPLVGKALVDIFEGELGKRLEKAASVFCACQSTNTELLNRFTRKDTKAGEFLAQVANQQMLGRLGIKDLLASCFQRLTKYPLLLENLLKATPNGISGIHSKSLSEGSISLCMATVQTPVILSTPTSDASAATTSITSTRDATPTNENHSTNHEQLTTDETKSSVITHSTNTISSCNNDDQIDNDDSNTSSANAIPLTTATTNTTPTIDEEYSYERLCISRALQQSRQILTHVNEAVKRAISHNKLRDIWKKTDKHPQLQMIDIETQQLIHEGNLTLRLGKRSLDVYVLLLTHYLVILTREGQDKYKLKHFTADGKPPIQMSPIFNIDEHLATRDTATDENGFYLLCANKESSRIVEFASQSPSERAKWKEKIHLVQQQNSAIVPDDDNTLTRYGELISLATSSNTPNNIEHSPTNDNIIATYT